MKNGKIHIQVIGVGGGGGNAINHIMQSNKDRARFIAVNTDLMALDALDVEDKIQIGERLTNGFGSGADPEIGKKAAEEDYEKICEMVSGSDLVFLATGLGGGTGTGATPVIAKAAKATGALIVAVVTLPFSTEGSQREEVAKKGLNELRQIVDSVICIPNDRITKLAGKDMSIEEAFRLSDDVLNNTFSAIANLIVKVGIVNIDYNDIMTVLKEKGESLVGFGDATGENSAVKAVRYAMASQLLERSDIVGAKKVLISFVSGHDATLNDVHEAIRIVHNKIRGEAHVIFGVITSSEFKSKTEVTLIATGLPEIDENQQQDPTFKPFVNPVQGTMDFLPAEKGLFAKQDPTFVNGVNYDTPTYIRWGRKLIESVA